MDPLSADSRHAMCTFEKRCKCLSTRCCLGSSLCTVQHDAALLLTAGLLRRYHHVKSQGISAVAEQHLALSLAWRLSHCCFCRNLKSGTSTGDQAADKSSACSSRHLSSALAASSLSEADERPAKRKCGHAGQLNAQRDAHGAAAVAAEHVQSEEQAIVSGVGALKVDAPGEARMP